MSASQKLLSALEEYVRELVKQELTNHRPDHQSSTSAATKELQNELDLLDLDLPPVTADHRQPTYPAEIISTPTKTYRIEDASSTPSVPPIVPATASDSTAINQIEKHPNFRYNHPQLQAAAGWVNEMMN